MMGCSKQHIRGHNAVHTGQKRFIQRGLRRIGYTASEDFNEISTMYTVPVGEQHSLQADTALARGSLSLCGDDVIAKQGIVLDTSATAPTTKGNLAGVKSNAALTDGYASARREAEKHRKHAGRYNSSRWKFVPFVQEAHGRLGKEAAEILGYLHDTPYTCDLVFRVPTMNALVQISRSVCLGLTVAVTGLEGVCREHFM
jgi:hypothetical protein